MQYNIKGTGLSITDELRTYVEKKLKHAGKFLASDPSAHTDTELEFAASERGKKYRAEFTIGATGALYRAEASGDTMHEAIDLAVAEVVKELTRGKKKRLHTLRRGAGKVKDMLRGFRDRF